MPGTPEGGRKAALTNKSKDPNFYANIGSKSWSNPNRSRETGFAKLPKEKIRELGAKGGKKTKADYKKEEFETAESLRAILIESEEVGPDTSQ